MNVLSLFDGMSCGQVALERAGIKVDKYFASEIEPSAIAVTQKNHPSTVQLGDVKGIKASDLPKIDLLIGGSPCQGFSRAGKQLNFDDPRSKLFFEYVRLLNEIRIVNPDVMFLLENVKMRNEWKEVITEYLGVQPIEINSKLVSGQNRPRLYWTNIPGVSLPQDKKVMLSDVLDSESAAVLDYDELNDIYFDKTISEKSKSLVSRVDGEIRINQTTILGYIVAEDGDGVNLSFPTSKSRRGRVIKGKSSTLDRVCNICVLQGNVIRRLSISELEKLQCLPVGYTEGIKEKDRMGAIGNGWTVDVIAHIFRGLR
ncbi:DNA (cytosine-5-)-methyltransferase [Neobacillus sp. DY30]|uniref:DNA (cytosine-5-)-methyltransferase n=1 Tax=Neobacillus sp. DY30 TaxID=3047871 RepID=UPI0024C02A92|nr:DNA (cytosine-5-)-methyltransferase [Neobacillus sp. DY30]WHY01855.1 DNA (cytosine-5-)-methyltransferase [Neobacillus sp. DY30]